MLRGGGSPRLFPPLNAQTHYQPLKQQRKTAALTENVLRIETVPGAGNRVITYGTVIPVLPRGRQWEKFEVLSVRSDPRTT